MSEHRVATSMATPRERELAIEVALLQAEVETLKGSDPAATTGRFLAMAAATVDQAVDAARREADEIVEGISAQAEARRDEATRVAAEAEAMAESLLAEADQSQARIERAESEAEMIKVVAREEADTLVSVERSRVAGEIEALAELRIALETERGVLESYHEELRRRVQELAESMVSFMTTESPIGAATAIENLVPPELESVLAENPELARVEPEAVDPVDPWLEMLETVIPADEQVVDVPESAIGEIPDGPPQPFDEQPIVESELGDDMKPTSAGLFSRARTDEDGDDVDALSDLAATGEDSDLDGADIGLFGMFDSRIVEKTSPEGLADAFGVDDADDDAFRQFLDGDDAPDPSRDWLLRPEPS
ncbi:MAG: hypothetical protein ACI9C1_003230 [Candidatus Aldehydirespiratoraceae bacterium]|jgi:hypothetical protein